MSTTGEMAQIDCITGNNAENISTRETVDKGNQASKQLELRKKIISLNHDPNLTTNEKARKIQELMSMSWTKSRDNRKRELNKDKNGREKSDLARIKRCFGMCTREDAKFHYHNEENNILGCKHYQRALKIQAYCCGKWYVCRFCHDDASNHTLLKSQIFRMMCMYCSTLQKLGNVCINEKCKKELARYYCSTCFLWDSDNKKDIYHCNDCGICRIGKGIGIDYFHCEKCNVCLAIGLKGKHRCIERNLECNCPICGDYLFTSTATVMFMKCCHCIHVKCYMEYIKRYYQCPTCFKSLADMTEHYKKIDNALKEEAMPDEYSNWCSQIYCNDCEKRCYAKYHFIYHKCVHCKGYNTRVIEIFKSTLNIPKEDLVLMNQSSLTKDDGGQESIVSTSTEK